MFFKKEDITPIINFIDELKSFLNDEKNILDLELPQFKDKNNVLLANKLQELSNIILEKSKE